MKREVSRDGSAPLLSAIFVDYDNIYLSLKRKNEDAAKRFSKNALGWLRGLETGRLLTPTHGAASEIGVPRRIVMNRCYGNPVPRRNQADSSTDMNSFPFVRHHFLRGGFEVVDCPPLTAQMKNSADIRMVMDMRDYLTHPTHFDEFIILSGDADFTPVLHRLRQHARRTFVYANDYTAAPYTAIADGEIREADLIALLLAEPGADAGHVTTLPQPAAQATAQATAQPLRLEDLRAAIIGEVVAGVRSSPAPVPLEALADRALRTIGHDRTVGTNWAGAGSFRELLRVCLPADIRLSENPPFFAYDPARHLIQAPQAYEPPRQIPLQPQQQVPMAQPPMAPSSMAQTMVLPTTAAPLAYADPQGYGDEPVYVDTASRHADPRNQAPLRAAMPRSHALQPVALQPAPPLARAPAPVAHEPAGHPAPLSSRHPANPAMLHRAAPQTSAPPPQRPDAATHVQKSIARIHEACQAPPMAPHDYRALFEEMAAEITENGLAGVQTLTAITQRTEERGLAVRRDDVRFVLEVISEADPWFEQGASANLFAGRFRNFVVARCRDQGLNLSAEELDLIDAWFAGAPLSTAGRAIAPPQAAPAAARAPEPNHAESAGQTASRANRWWSNEPAPVASAPAGTEEDFPRIARTRRG